MIWSCCILSNLDHFFEDSLFGFCSVYCIWDFYSQFSQTGATRARIGAKLGITQDCIVPSETRALSCQPQVVKISKREAAI